VRGAPPPWARKLFAVKAARRLITLLAGIAGLLLILAVSGARVVRQDVGHVGVVRNGGPLDNRAVRQIVMPGSGPTWVGWFSQPPHEYPASRVLRTYMVTSDAARGARLGADVVHVPTKDGVQIGIEGTVYYHFTGELDPTLLTRFDSTAGTRQYRGEDGGLHYPYQGDQGWNAMIETLFRPVLENDLRRELGRFQCAELVPSCALLHEITGKVPPVEPGASIAAIEQAINASLVADLTDTLGKPYFWGARFRLSRVSLPTNVQTSINNAQASYADVADAKAKAQQAAYKNEANRKLAETYDKSPALANIEALKAIPKGSTVLFTGSGKTPSLLVGAGGQTTAATTPGPPVK
jgi:regulator of protease activity HflC (stomatin/prohibitin superfamily)